MNHVQKDKQVLHCKKNYSKNTTVKIIYDHIW